MKFLFAPKVGQLFKFTDEKRNERSVTVLAWEAWVEWASTGIYGLSSSQFLPHDVTALLAGFCIGIT